MTFTNEDKILIKCLRESKRYSARRFLAEFPNKNWKLGGLNALIRKIDSFGTIQRLPGQGRPRSVRTVENIAAVEGLVLSQDDQPQTHRTQRQITAETGIKRTSVRRIIKQDLMLKCLKRSRAQSLTEASKVTRLVRAHQLLRSYPAYLVNFIWFTDEKVFTVLAPSNTQNDRVYTGAAMRKKQLAPDRVLRTRSNFSKSVMVSVGVSVLGSTSLHFVEPGVKVNGAYYRDVLLTQKLLPEIRELSGDAFFTFQQDSAPAHRARETIALLERETPDFIPPTLWPPNSPDLNPVDYKIWSVMQERVYRGRITDVEHLKQRVSEEWDKLDHSIIVKAIRQWRRRLLACVRADGGHFEFNL
jgi:inhibitor of nuclear factor kappa-B kinase subunit alpha